MTRDSCVIRFQKRRSLPKDIFHKCATGPGLDSGQGLSTGPGWVIDRSTGPGWVIDRSTGPGLAIADQVP